MRLTFRWEVLVAHQPQEAPAASPLALLAQHRQVLARGHQRGAGAMLQPAVAVARDHGHPDVAVGREVEEGRAPGAQLEGDLRFAAKSPYAVPGPDRARPGRRADHPGAGRRAGSPPIPGQFLEQLFATLPPCGPAALPARGPRWLRYLTARPARDPRSSRWSEMLDGPLGQDSKGVFAEVAAAAREVLASTTIQDVIDREAREQGQTMYWI